MPFYIINEQPVFLSLSRHKEIREEVLKTKSATCRVASAIANSKETKETEELMYGFLRVQYNKNPKQFYSEWVHFDIVGDNASKNVYDLLYDYCFYYGYAHLSDLRNFQQKLTDDYTGDSYTYPLGQAFALDHFVKPRKWWWKYTAKMDGRNLRLIIIPKNTYRLVGDLREFMVYTKDFHLKCGSNLVILPSKG